MIPVSFIDPLRKALRFYSVLALAILLFQLTGIIMYFINVWPGVRGSLSGSVTFVVGLGFVLVLVRSCLWVWIYRSGARAFSVFRREAESVELAEHLSPILMTLTRLLVMSCIMDVFFVPLLFMSDVLLPISVAGWWLGAIDLTILLFPQAFGIAALILAFLTYQFAQLLNERSDLRKELELTI